MEASDWGKAGAHALRKYIWQLLQQELLWDKVNYGGLTPITTAEQQPEFNNFNFPYVVYAYTRSSTSNLWAVEGEVMTLSIYSQAGSDIDRAVTMLGSKLNKRDETAKEINKFISTTEPVGSFYRNFDFKSVSVTGAQGPQAVSTEGGRRDGYITLSYIYTVSDSTHGALHV